METSIVLSKEEKNRVCIWLTVLFKVNNYCAVCEEQESKKPHPHKEEDWGFYFFHGRPCYYSSPNIIIEGLTEAAIIGLSSIFNYGDSGEGIAKNDCISLKLIRKEMLKRTAIKLGHDDISKIEAYIRNIVALRNQLIAHYDGSAADYSEDYFYKYDEQGSIIEKEPGITKMKVPGTRFSQDEIIELKDITIKMHEALIELLTELDNQSSE